MLRLAIKEVKRACTRLRREWDLCSLIWQEWISPDSTYFYSFGFAENLIWQVGLLIGLSSVSKTNKANVVQIPSPRDHGFGWLSCAASRGRCTFCCKFEDQISQEIRRSSNFVWFQSNFPPKRGLKSIQIPGLFKVRIVACADGVRRRAQFVFLFLFFRKEGELSCLCELANDVWT